MTCKFGTGGAHRLACSGGKRRKGAKHLHVRCTCTVHSSPLNRTAPSTLCQGLPTYRVWCLWLKISLHRRTPRQKSFPTLARAACTPQERQPQKHICLGCIRVTCKFGVGGASCFLYKFSSNVLLGRIRGIRAFTKHSLLCWP